MSTYENDLSRLVEELNRSVPSAAARAKSTSFDTVVAEAAKEGASDLLLIAGSVPILRIHGMLHPAKSSSPLTDGQLRDMLLPLLSHAQSERLERQRAIDLSLLRPPAGRLRANLHYQRGSLAASIRLLPAEIPTLESLHLPTSLAMLAERRQGLVLLTGPTGCGKSSTMAALVERMNARRRDHIITIEDPIEWSIGSLCDRRRPFAPTMEPGSRA
jgi:twitching motility protein PilT